MCQVTDNGGGFDGQDAGGGGVDEDEDDDDDAGVDFGLSVADDMSQTQFVASQLLDDVTCDATLLTGDNLLAVPRKVRHGRLSFLLILLARDSMLRALYAIARPSVCLSVRPSHGWISRKRLKLGSCNFHVQ